MAPSRLTRIINEPDLWTMREINKIANFLEVDRDKLVDIVWREAKNESEEGKVALHTRQKPFRSLPRSQLENFSHFTLGFCFKTHVTTSRKALSPQQPGTWRTSRPTSPKARLGALQRPIFLR